MHLNLQSHEAALMTAEQLEEFAFSVAWCGSSAYHSTEVGRILPADAAARICKVQSEWVEKYQAALLRAAACT